MKLKFPCLVAALLAFSLTTPLAANSNPPKEGKAFPDADGRIALGDSDESSLRLGGQARFRVEAWENFGFAADQDDVFGLLRLRAHADLQLGPHFRAFVEAKSATATDRDLPGGRRGLDVDELDLQKGLIDLAAPAGDWTGTLRLGRQELSFGAQRLVSPLDWSNTRRSWDGVRAILENEAWRVDAFATQFVPVKKYEFNEPDPDQEFQGLHATHTLSDAVVDYDLYLLRLNREDLDDDRYTAGLRLNGTCPMSGVGFDLEGGYQFGDRVDQDISAWFAAAVLRYGLPDFPASPVFSLGYDYASGDSNPDGGDAETFHQLYPLGHAYLGYIDIVGRQNISDFSPAVTLTPFENSLKIKLAYHIFRRAESEDALYNAGGAVVRAGDAGDSKDVGSELDLSASWKLSPDLSASAGYSRFFAGDFISESGPDEEIDFFYTAVQTTF